MAQQANYIVYDLETSGLKAGTHGVMEIAMMGIDCVTLEEIARYEALICPYQIMYEDEDGNEAFKDYEVNQIALDINGLTMKKIETSGKPAKEVIKDIDAFVKKCKSGSKKPVLVGHNIIKFDNPHLANFFMSNKKDPGKFFDSNYFVDTQQESHKMFPECTGRGENTLAKLCERFGVDKFDAHSAMPDVIANAAVFIKILQKQRGESIAMEVVEKDRPRDTFKF